MKINVQLDWKDYLKAQRLHMRLPLVQRVIIYFLLAVFVLALVAYLILTLPSGGGLQFILWIWPVLLIGAFFVLYYLVLLPWNIRRIFSQQKELAAPFEHEITETALVSSSQYGSGTRPWANFHKWKEDQDLLMLYLSDIMFIMIPKRFCTPEQVEAIRAHLVENNIPHNRRNPVRLVLLAVFFLLLIAVAVVTYMTLSTSLP